MPSIPSELLGAIVAPDGSVTFRLVPTDPERLSQLLFHGAATDVIEGPDWTAVIRAFERQGLLTNPLARAVVVRAGGVTTRFYLYGDVVFFGAGTGPKGRELRELPEIVIGILTRAEGR